MRRLFQVSLVSAAMAAATLSRADDGSHVDYDTERTEPAGFPIIGGNSDIGLQFGAVSTLTHFYKGKRPYLWNLDLLFAMSVKDTPEGLSVIQQNYYSKIDLTDLFGGHVRTRTALYYVKSIDTGYYGLGNASTFKRPPIVDGDRRRYFQYVSREVRLRSFNRYHLAKPFDLVIAPILRYHDPDIYPGSKLAIDAATKDANGHPLVYGTRQTTIGSFGFGLQVDTRDNEFFPRSGMLHEIGTRVGVGLPLDNDVEFGGTGLIFRNYFPLPGPFVFATRLVVDFLYGNVPFYDLYNAGPFNVWEMIGGGSGVRGVPLGRYSGPIKVVGNAELRAMLTHFRLFGQKFGFGGSTFFDTGRLWEDYTFESPLDGDGLGLKWGTGIGTYFQWGDAAVFRIEAAYSPDAEDVRPDFPIALYVADRTMF